jgi:hypothetical protein
LTGSDSVRVNVYSRPRETRGGRVEGRGEEMQAAGPSTDVPEEGTAHERAQSNGKASKNPGRLKTPRG